MAGDFFGFTIVPRSPPLLTCRLPGPWHDSQPMFLALSPGAFNRAWVAVRKSRVIVSWQVSQLSDPANSAPGMLGGARMARLESKLLRESRTSVSEAPPPIAHQSLSRLPWTHRVKNRRCHTPWSRIKSNLGWLRIFTGKNPDPFLGGNPGAKPTQRCPFCLACAAARYSLGDFPESFLKMRLNCESDWKPAAKAISLTRRLPLPRSVAAFS